MLCGIFKQASDFFADNRAHTAHHKAGLHHEHRTALMANLGCPADNALLLTTDGSAAIHFILIPGKFQRVNRFDIGK